MLSEWRVLIRERWTWKLSLWALLYALVIPIVPVEREGFLPFALPYLVLIFHLFVQMLRLRILDDLGDLETDRILHPDRPLPRGACSPKAALLLSGLLFTLELPILLFIPSPFIILPASLAITSWLLHRDFFLPGSMKAMAKGMAALYPVLHYLAIACLIGDLAGKPLPRGDYILSAGICLASILIQTSRFLRRTRSNESE